MSRASDGMFLGIDHVTCQPEVIYAIRLVHPTDSEFGDANDVVLWEVSSEQGSSGGVFTVGVTPPGFEEGERFSEPLAEDQKVLAVVETNGRVWATVAFTTGDLEPNKVFVGRGETNVDPAEFERRAAESCSG